MMDNGERIWICGQVRAETPDGVVWDFQGVFASREQAVAACRDANYFVAPASFGVSFPHELMADWPEGEYPLRST